MFRKKRDINYIYQKREQMNMIDEKRNDTNNFKWQDDKKMLLNQTYNNLLKYKLIINFSTNILEEAFYYITHFYNDDYHISIILELDIVDGYSDYRYSEINDNKLYEVINEIDLLNRDIATLKNSIDLKRRKYVGAFLEISPYGGRHRWRLIQIDNLYQLKLLKRYIDCGSDIYKTI